MRLTGRALRAAGAVCAIGWLAGLPSPLRAQERSSCTGNCVAIQSTGGFLGYLDGFPEFPGWIGDTFADNPDLLPNRAPQDPKQPVPYGGLLGVATYLKSHTIAGGNTLLLISGNNHPQQIAALRNPMLRNDNVVPPAASHWFWKPMIEMTPQAVGVGTEDIHRWLAQMRPEHLAAWIQDGIAAGLPLVASNVIVRMTGSGLNVVRNDEHRITIDVTAGESLDFLDSLTMVHPCGISETLRSATFAFDAGPSVSVKAEPRPERESVSNKARRAVLGDVCKTTLEFAQRLRPGKSYLLASSVTGPGFRFRLTTHRVLTPHAAWDGAPVVAAAPGGIPMAIMSVLSPMTAHQLPPEYFEWDQDRGCPAAKCRIEFLTAGDALASLVDVVRTPGGPPPILAVISDLHEAEESALLDAVPEIRVMVLPPDSARLGRAAPAVSVPDARGRRFSGDISFGAVIDAQHPELTRLMVRPTWLGEIVHTAFADFTAAPDQPWRAGHASVWHQPVPGASLGWQASSNGVRYTAFLDPQQFKNSPAPVSAEPAIFKAYCPIDPNGPFDAASGERQGDLWTSPGGFAGLVLDDMRRSLRGDIAMVPESWIDSDVIATLATPPPTGVPPLSGFMLQRILYRSKRVVRVTVEGSALGGLLKRIVDGAASGDDAVCVSGLGLVNSCPLESIDVDELLINVRKPEDGNIYRLVLPSSIARAEGLAFDESDTRDLLVGLDARLSSCHSSSSSALKPAAEPVAERLENRLAASAMHYFKLDPLTFEYASTSVTEDGYQGVFSRLPVDGSGEQPSRRIAVAADLDGVLWDTPRYALRLPAQLRYSQSRVDQAVSYDDDEFSIGVRFDAKRFPVRWARLFAGVFIDGRMFNQTESVDASRRLGPITDPQFREVTLENVTIPGPTLAFTTKPQRNFSGAYGLEVAEQTFGPLTVTGLQFSQYHGRVYNVPVGVQLGDHTILLDQFLQSRASTTLNAFYQQDLTGITELTPFGYITATRGQSRTQIDAKTSTTIPLSIPLTLATEHRYRWYRHDEDATGLFTERSADTKISLDIGIGRRWSVGPYADWSDVTVGITDAVDQHFSVFRWGFQVKVPLFWNGRLIE